MLHTKSFGNVFKLVYNSIIAISLLLSYVSKFTVIEKSTDFGIEMGPLNPAWVLITLRSLSVTFKWLTNEFTIVTSAFHITKCRLFFYQGIYGLLDQSKIGPLIPTYSHFEPIHLVRFHNSYISILNFRRQDTNHFYIHTYPPRLLVLESLVMAL